MSLFPALHWLKWLFFTCFFIGACYNIETILDNQEKIYNNQKILERRLKRIEKLAKQ